MTIVCGVDFSEASSCAIRVAACLASMMKVPLHLVHAADPEPDDDDAGPRIDFRKQSLSRRAHALHERGIDVHAHAQVGSPDQVLAEVAKEVSATLIVVGAIGHRRGKDFRLGSHSDRLAQKAQVPVLVARDAVPFEAWANQLSALRVLFGVDFSTSAANAARVLTELVRHGRCHVTAAYLYWPPTEWRRLGLSGIRGFLDRDPEMTQAIERDLFVATEELRQHVDFELCTEPHLGSLSEGLVQVAAEEHADLIVVGSHGRNAVRRIWEGSVSRGVLDAAKVSVLCVPSTASAVRAKTGCPRSVLVATDFSSLGDAAVELAYSIVGDGGLVHLVHVMRREIGDSLAPHDVFETGSQDREIEERLRALISSEAPARQLTSELHVLKSDDVAEGIHQAAERLGVDLICLGTRGRGRVSRALLGSVAEGVLSRTSRPLLLSPPTRA